MPEASRFTPFGPDHWAVLIGTVSVAATLIVSRRRLRELDDRRCRRSLALGLALNELLSWAIALSQGQIRLPLQLCDLALALTVWTLWHPRPAVSELAYFWGLAGSLQAVITPDLAAPWPSYWWWKFFAGHCGIVLSVIYLAVTGRVQSSARSIWRVWLWTNAYAAVGGIVNWVGGTNLGYLARKPSQPSLLDYFGPWPWYILVMEVVALLSFYVYSVPLIIGRQQGGGDDTKHRTLAR